MSEFCLEMTLKAGHDLRTTLSVLTGTPRRLWYLAREVPYSHVAQSLRKTVETIGTRYRQQRNIPVPTLSQPVVFPLKKLVLSMFFSMCDVWSRSGFRVTTCTFFSADVSKTIDRVLTTHPLQTVIKLSFVANGSESFRVPCFACWTSPDMILLAGASTCFRTQDTEYDL